MECSPKTAAKQRNKQTFFENIFFSSIPDSTRCHVSKSEIKSSRFSLFLVLLDIDIESLKIEIHCNEKSCTYIDYEKKLQFIVSFPSWKRTDLSALQEWKKIVQGLVFSLSPDETDKTRHISSSFVRNSHGQWSNEWIAILICPSEFRNVSVHERMKILTKKKYLLWSNYPVLSERLPIISNSSDRKISAHALNRSVYLQKLSLICRL